MLRIILFIALIGWALYRISNLLLGKAPGQKQARGRRHAASDIRVDNAPNAAKNKGNRKFDDAEYVDYKEVN